jgi:hypothetical protein
VAPTDTAGVTPEHHLDPDGHESGDGASLPGDVVVCEDGNDDPVDGRARRVGCLHGT